MTDEKRPLELYELALSVVEAKGVVVAVGSTPYREYRAGTLTIIYLAKSSHLDVWYRRKVLTINRRGETLKVENYTPGEWEDERAEGKCKNQNHALLSPMVRSFARFASGPARRKKSYCADQA